MCIIFLNYKREIRLRQISKMEILQNIAYLLSTSYTGVDHTIPGNGGLDCYYHVSVWHRIFDTFLFTLFLVIFILPRVLKTISLPSEQDVKRATNKERSWEINLIQRVLLVALWLILGIEVIFKIGKNTWIYLLNPCHVLTAMQIFLLSTRPSRIWTAVFRIQIHLLFGGILATIFPVTNTRSGIYEHVNYWLHHICVTFIVPPFLIYSNGNSCCEPLRDMSWALLTILVFAFYMFYVLQTIAMTTLVNLNSMLCPAVSDPFYGANYRWFAMIHQQLLILSLGKVYSAIVITLVNFVKNRRLLTNNNNNNEEYHLKSLTRND